MKRLLLLAAVLLLLPSFPLPAREQKVRDVWIRLTLIQNGSVVVHERWDVDTGDGITEWYLVRENLGDIEITRFSVFDGDDKLEDDGEWNVNRTREEKAGRYGIVHKSNGVELCWGVGEYGDHEYHAVYTMKRAVKTLDDYDMLHLQVVSPGLSSPPEHVYVQVRADETQLDTTNTRIWGFGFEGRSSFEEDGSVVFESEKPFGTDDSVIILLRFNKGLFQSPSVQERPFQEVLDRAMEGASFEEKDTAAEIIAYLMTFLVMYFLFIRPFIRLFRGGGEKKLALGFNPKKVSWYRDIPMQGDLRAANYILSRSGNEPSSGGLPLAAILRLIYQGCIQVTREADGLAVLSFPGTGLDKMDPACQGIFSMLKDAARGDGLLQEKEFSKWASNHGSVLSNWASRNRIEGISALSRAGWYNSSRVTLSDSGKEEARKLFGLKQFLSDFTLVDKREAIEAKLWKEYMVYGALFGITDRVARQLKEIDPSLFRETFHFDAGDFDSVLSMGRTLSRAVQSAALARSYSSSSSSYSGHSSSSSRGYGGSTSHRGGGGYSGGGRGGGGR